MPNNSLLVETQKELVSIIIPTCNRISTFKDALESAQQQEYCTLEILILDNSADDKVNAFLENVKDTRIRFIKHPCNIGAIMNIVYGFCAARGDYLCLLGDDDIMKPQFICTGVGLLKQNSDANAISFAYDTFQITSNTDIAAIERKGPIDIQMAGIRHLSNKQRKINIGSTLFRSCIKNKIQRFYYAGLALDTALLADLILDEKLLYSDKILYNYRVHPEQVSKRQATETICDEINVYEKMLKRRYISRHVKQEITHNLIHSYTCLRDKLVIDEGDDIPVSLLSINKRLLQLDLNNIKRWLTFFIGEDVYKFLRKVAYGTGK